MTPPFLNLIVLRTGDLERSCRFYEALGLTLVREKHGSGPEHVSASMRSMVLEVYPQGTQVSTAGVRLGFQVQGLEETLAAALTAGGVLLSAPRLSPWGWRAVLQDPDGHVVELVQPTSTGLA